MDKLLNKIRQCQICSTYLPLAANPVVRASEKSKILIIGQAPGIKVHHSGIPWDDASGKNLRKWMDINEQQFYDPDIFAIVPMGFCYPGKGHSGDLPPRPECAPEWHQKLFNKMPNIELTLLIGQYAQAYYLKNHHSSLTETVKAFKTYLPSYFPLVHPSPRNGIWLRKNPWFEIEVLPVLKNEIGKVLEK